MSIAVIANIIGLMGTTLVVGSYVLMQTNQLDPKGLRFNLINLAGAVFLLISLFVHFNLASFIIEVFWIGASLIGLYNYWRSKQKN